MADYITYHRPKTVIHEVNAAEATSGVARVTFIDMLGTDELAYTYLVKQANTNMAKTEYITYYESNSGIVMVKNGVNATAATSGIADRLASGDTITITGQFYV